VELVQYAIVYIFGIPCYTDNNYKEKDGEKMNKRGNMTEGKEWRHLLMFALPLMAGHALQQLYNTVDGIVVGNFVGDTALAAVGACGPLTMLFVALAIGMGTGSAVVIGQYYGARKLEEMRRAVSSSIILMVTLGAVLSIVGVIVARPMLTHVMSVGEQYIEYAVDYFAIYAIGLVLQFAYNIFASVLRALGDSRAMLYFLIISSVTNTVLDLVFVVVFHWGVAGAAIATVISQALAAVCAGIYMFRKHEVLRFKKGEFRFYKSSAALTMRIAIPNTLQQTIISCGNLALQRIINDYGQIYNGLMAGATAGLRLESFILIPIFTFNASLSTFSSQNVGAGKLDRVKRARKAGMLMGVAFCVTVTAIALIFRGPLVSLFGVSPEGLSFGKLYLSILCPPLFIFCLSLTTGGVMQGAGDVKFSAILTLSSFVFRIIFAYTLAYNTSLEYMAVWISQPTGWLLVGIANWIRYYSGAWMKKGIAHVET